jgi:hypothetical protein
VESGAAAPALQDLSAFPTRRVNAQRRGVRHASAALAVKPALSTNLQNLVSRPVMTPSKLFPQPVSTTCFPTFLANLFSNLFSKTYSPTSFPAFYANLFSKTSSPKLFSRQIQCRS